MSRWLAAGLVILPLLSVVAVAVLICFALAYPDRDVHQAAQPLNKSSWRSDR